MLFSDEHPSGEDFVCGIEVEAALDDYKYTKDFLMSYSRRSVDTFDKFRTEAERLLLWSWLVCEKSIVDLRRRDFEDYIDFVVQPPKSWLAETTQRRFLN